VKGEIVGGLENLENLVFVDVLKNVAVKIVGVMKVSYTVNI